MLCKGLVRRNEVQKVTAHPCICRSPSANQDHETRCFPDASILAAGIASTAGQTVLIAVLEHHLEAKARCYTARTRNEPRFSIVRRTSMLLPSSAKGRIDQRASRFFLVLMRKKSQREKWCISPLTVILERFQSELGIVKNENVNVKQREWLTEAENLLRKVCGRLLLLCDLQTC